MIWTRMTKTQQTAARQIRDALSAAGYDASVSQVAKYFDQAMDWKRGEITLSQLTAAMEA